MDIILNGANGRMGRTITEKIDQGYEDYRIVAKVDPHNGDYASLSEVREKGDQRGK